MEKTYIQPISTLWETFPASKTQEKKGDSTIPFADIFQSAIENVKETDGQKNHLEYQLATGQLDNPAELTIASTKAATAVELLVQLRNKALESYSELMRISI